MLTRLQLHNIGPVPNLEGHFGERLNLITGDNGLGKTFLLDACWYALTRTWADNRPFFPSPEIRKEDPPTIEFEVRGKTTEAVSGATFDFASQSWRGRPGRPTMPGIVVYARIDGGFSVWDPARNYWHADEQGPVRPNAFHFGKSEIWNGFPAGATQPEEVVCNGLLRDVENWRLRGTGAFQMLQRVLKEASPTAAEVLQIGDRTVRVGLGATDIPTLQMPYGPVPVTQAAAGVRRVLALAYLLVWVWDEHRRAAAQLREPPTGRLVLLFDEVEAHLHPKWQRVFLPALLEVAEELLLGLSESVQIIATTHSPMIPGSVEALWSGACDRLFDFQLVGQAVEFREIPFHRYGSPENWLTSESFDLSSSAPVAAERAMVRANAFMRQHPDPRLAPLDESEALHTELLAALGGDDEYWPLWVPYYQTRRAQG